MLLVVNKNWHGEELEENQMLWIESRFFLKEEADQRCPNGIRLFLTNQSVTLYNQSVLNSAPNKITSTLKNIYVGCHNAEQNAFVHQKYHKMLVIDTGGLPYEITFVLNKSYMLTTNINVLDGLANGAMGKLVHIECNDANEVTRVWLEFPDSPNTGAKLRKRLEFTFKPITSVGWQYLLHDERQAHL